MIQYQWALFGNRCSNPINAGVWSRPESFSQLIYTLLSCNYLPESEINVLSKALVEKGEYRYLPEMDSEGFIDEIMIKEASG